MRKEFVHFFFSSFFFDFFFVKFWVKNGKNGCIFSDEKKIPQKESLLEHQRVKKTNRNTHTKTFFFVPFVLGVKENQISKDDDDDDDDDDGRRSDPVPDDHMKANGIGPPPNASLMTIPCSNWKTAFD